MAEYIENPGEGVGVCDAQEVETPRRFRVLLHNDHYTTMDFVVEILEGVFDKSSTEAMRIMRNVHENGMGIAGVYIRAIAETKVALVHKLAREQGFPLRCSLSPE